MEQNNLLLPHCLMHSGPHYLLLMWSLKRNSADIKWDFDLIHRAPSWPLSRVFCSCKVKSIFHHDSVHRECKNLHFCTRQNAMASPPPASVQRQACTDECAEMSVQRWLCRDDCADMSVQTWACRGCYFGEHQGGWGKNWSHSYSFLAAAGWPQAEQQAVFF